ncbi:MAG: pilus assembly protein PilP [Betaproteobacteria bacterium]|nr:pilus assembly protein PilP [Betaproteobacteria bacterium]
MRLAILLLAWSAGCFAQVPKVLVTTIQPSLKPQHALQLDGTTIVYTTRFGAEVETKRITPPPERWEAFRKALDRDKVWRWKESYQTSMKDSTRWLVKIEYADRSLTSSGLGAFPVRSADKALPRYSFTRYRLALQELLGEPFERRIRSVELFNVKELRLVGTNPGENWASFRDPAGKVHQVSVKEFAGADAMLQKVDTASVEVSVLSRNPAGEWMEEPRTLKVVAK